MVSLLWIWNACVAEQRALCKRILFYICFNLNSENWIFNKAWLEEPSTLKQVESVTQNVFEIGKKCDQNCLQLAALKTGFGGNDYVINLVIKSVENF